MFCDFWAKAIVLIERVITATHKQLGLLVITLFVFCPYFYTHSHKLLFMLFFWP